MTETKDDEAHSNVFALGDVSMLASGKLPPVGSVAHQQAQFLAKLLNARSKGKAFEQTFHFKESTKVRSSVPAGMSGDDSKRTGLLPRQRRISQSEGRLGLRDWVRLTIASPMEIASLTTYSRGAWALWRENYARSLSTQKRISLALNWIMTATFGRDLVRV